jgi:hypothetical protein
MRGTDIGFNKAEIQDTSSEDLINLRKSILLYLKSKKLKKRNGKFADVFKRINEELRRRKSCSSDAETASQTSESCENKSIAPKRTASSSFSSSISLDNIDFKDYTFLGRKQSSSTSILNLDIPNFLNDKITKEIKKNIQSTENKGKFYYVTIRIRFVRKKIRF